jgi:hypothetical protein
MEREAAVRLAAAAALLLTACAAAPPPVVERDTREVEAAHRAELERQAEQRATEHAAAEEARAESQAEATAEAKAAADALMATARKHGFKRLYVDRSLAWLAGVAVERGTPVKALRVIAVQLGERDAGFVALQVLPNNEALFTDSEGVSTLRLIARKFKGSVYEGTPLTALRHRYWRIAETRTYPTAIGGTAQAFVVEPAW